MDTVIVVDNDGPEVSRVRDLMAAQPISTTYPGWRPNLGGAGGFALGLLHTMAQDADRVWLTATVTPRLPRSGDATGLRRKIPPGRSVTELPAASR